MFEKSQCFCAGTFEKELEVDVGEGRQGRGWRRENCYFNSVVPLLPSLGKRLALGLLMWSLGNRALEHVS